MSEKETNYCRQCVMQEGDSTLTFDETGLCSDCKGGDNDAMVRRITRLVSNFEEFKNSGDNEGNYDCTVMFSGGKDSIYMLYLLLNEYKRKPLAFTLNLFLESTIAMKHIEHVIETLRVPHYYYSPDRDVHKGLMQSIFYKDSKEITKIANNHSPEKTPCLVCTYYMVLLTVLFTHQMGVPYVVYCADPAQVLNLPGSVEDIVGDFTRFVGEGMVRKTFGTQLDDLLKSDRLPKIVYPYAKVSYDAERIMAELNQLGLYDAHPLETHCKLFGLLNYFGIKKFNRFMYTVELSVEVRRGVVDRDEAIKRLEGFKKSFLKIEAEGTVGDEEKEEFKNLLRLVGGSESGVNYLCGCIVDLPKIAKEMGIELEAEPSALPADAGTTVPEDGGGDFGF